ncbi:MAG: hypothetical protein ACE5L6_02000 [Candidatus Bathyarchaeia archaeon]
MADLTSFLVGCVVGFIAGAVVFTATGREVTAEVTRAGARRVARYVEPRPRR